MIDEHTRLEAFRRDLRVTTDPAWVREQHGQEQFSRMFIVVAALVGALAFYGVFMAVASI